MKKLLLLLLLAQLISQPVLALYQVERVIDGDTIKLSNGEKVRYIGIDTPETKHPKKPAWSSTSSRATSTAGSWLMFMWIRSSSMPGWLRTATPR